MILIFSQNYGKSKARIGKPSISLKFFRNILSNISMQYTQLKFTRSKSTIETLEKGVKHVHS